MTCLLQDGSDESLNMEGVGSGSMMEINTMSAILFVVVASCFLVMLYKLMSFWFIEVLVVLFCIGGVEVCQFLLSDYVHLYFHDYDYQAF